MPSWLIRVLQVVVALTLPLVLLMGNVQLLMHERFVHYEYGKASFPPDTAVPVGGYRLSRVERTALAEKALESIVGSRGLRVLEEARFQETGAPAFNAREVRHMRDVRRVFERARLLGGVGGAGRRWCDVGVAGQGAPDGDTAASGQRGRHLVFGGWARVFHRGEFQQLFHRVPPRLF